MLRLIHDAIKCQVLHEHVHWQQPLHLIVVVYRCHLHRLWIDTKSICLWTVALCLLWEKNQSRRKMRWENAIDWTRLCVEIQYSHHAHHALERLLRELLATFRQLEHGYEQWQINSIANRPAHYQEHICESIFLKPFFFVKVKRMKREERTTELQKSSWQFFLFFFWKEKFEFFIVDDLPFDLWDNLNCL